METSIVLAGATGLIGSHLVKVLGTLDTPPRISTVQRRADNPANQYVHAIQSSNLFDVTAKHLPDDPNWFISTLGTTIKQAGSEEAFRSIDHDLVIHLAKAAQEAGCRNAIVISAYGVSPDSKAFYNRVKGEMEQSMEALGFECLHILQPSLLVGSRDHFRFGEKMGAMLTKPFRLLMPQTVRPIEALTVAKAMAYWINQTPEPGVFRHTGAAIRASANQLND